MKKTLRSIILSFIAVFTFVVAGCSCNFFTETYSGKGMTITMDRGFEEETSEEYDYTWFLTKRDAMMIAIKEEFEEGFSSTEYTLEEYTDLVQDANLTNHPVHTRENENYMYYSYNASSEGNTYYYMVTTHVSADAFWIIQFVCFAEDKSKFEPKFLTWADSVTFDADANTQTGEGV
ncbi:MAG: hypothetical protein IKJ30_04940 [Bacilli bacterium]|nr:hypothetical protein [Bacilli bacterium]